MAGKPSVRETVVKGLVDASRALEDEAILMMRTASGLPGGGLMDGLNRMSLVNEATKGLVGSVVFGVAGAVLRPRKDADENDKEA